METIKEESGDNKGIIDGTNDYKMDTIPSFPNELKGNSAEGFVMDQAMAGYGAYAAPGRPDHANHNTAPGAFIQGGNPANTAAAGKPMSANDAFMSTEK